MPDVSGDNWHTTQLTRQSRVLRLIAAALFALFVIIVVLNANSELSHSFLGDVIFMTLSGVAAYEFLFIFRSGLRWNEHKIQQTGTLLPSPTHRWDDISSAVPNMHKRATILTFKGMRSVRLYWGYEAHREILEFANGKMKNAGAS